jgi:hypothetical protein
VNRIECIKCFFTSLQLRVKVMTLSRIKIYLLSIATVLVLFTKTLLPTFAQIFPMPIYQCSCTILVPDVCNNPDCQCRLVVTWVQYAFLDCCLENKLPGTAVVREGIYDCKGKKISNGVWATDDFISRNCPHCTGPA